MPVELRANDRLIWELLRRLAPATAELPFNNKHWKFQTHEQRLAMERSFPSFFQAEARSARVNRDWRQTFATQLYDEIRGQIFRSSGSDIFDVVHRPSIEKFLESPSLADAPNRYFIYSLYTLSVLFSNEWLVDIDVGRPVVIDLTKTADA